MNYEVKITETALEQMKETVDYISNVLREPKIAEKWIDGILGAIKGLEYMPEIYSLTEEQIWAEKGIRKLQYKNHYVYFWIDKTAAKVWVVTVIYAKRCQINQLKDLMG